MSRTSGGCSPVGMAILRGDPPDALITVASGSGRYRCEEMSNHYLKLACSPCMFVHDNKVLSCWFAQAKCMTGITPSAVLASIDELLAPASTGALRVVD